jgi:hypothetical protein
VTWLYFRSRHKLIIFIGVVLLATILILQFIGTQSAKADPPPQVGFSFSPKAAEWLGEDANSALKSLLVQLHPDVIRLPVYWDIVETKKGVFDFSEPNSMLQTVENYNSTHPKQQVKVILVIGVRNIDYPEVYVPDWVPNTERDPLAEVTTDPEYSDYLKASVSEYAKSKLLMAWQIENEPLDNSPTILGTNVVISQSNIAGDINLIHSIDTSHRIVVTTYDSSTLSLDLSPVNPDPKAAKPAGHPKQALQTGDVLGMDVYVATGDTNLNDASAQKRSDWKMDELKYWGTKARQSGKELWVTEMQGASWPGKNNFTTNDLLYSAQLYRKAGANMVLLWGVESWLQSPSWMSAGQQARNLLAN